MIRRLVSTELLFVYAALLLGAGLLLAFWVAPVDSSTMGFAQKIFYFHVPIAEVALVAFGISFVAAVLFLRRPDPRWDELGVAGVRLGLFFSALVMVTGMIWGRAAWGVWWAWEPRLTTFLVACVLYAAYFVVRAAVDDEQRRATVAAVFAIVAFIDEPVTLFATRYLPEGLHPVVFTTSGASMEGSMLLAFLVSMAGMTFLLAGMVRLETALAAARRELEDLKDALEGEGGGALSVEDAAVYVAEAYGTILVALVVMYVLAARRLTALRRQVAALRAAVAARRAATGPAVAQSGLAAPPSAGPLSNGEGGS